MKLPETLKGIHDKTDFDCGKESLNVWLKKYASQNQRNYLCQVYVTTAEDSNKVLGYYAIAPGSVSHQDAPANMKKRLPKHPIPVVILARLAVDKTAQGTGLGVALLKDALKRILSAAEITGGRAVIVHALDEEARAFYLNWDFEPYEGEEDNLSLYLLMQDLEAAFGGTSQSDEALIDSA